MFLLLSDVLRQSTSAPQSTMLSLRRVHQHAHTCKSMSKPSCAHARMHARTRATHDARTQARMRTRTHSRTHAARARAHAQILANLHGTIEQWRSKQANTKSNLCVKHFLARAAAVNINTTISNAELGATCTNLHVQVHEQAFVRACTCARVRHMMSARKHACAHARTHARTLHAHAHTRKFCRACMAP